MRAYYFGNMYLSSIQQGIQAAHVTHELFLKYPDDVFGNEAVKTLYEWAKNHKTMILLNGGYAESLEDLHAFFQSPTNPYPFTWFHEEKASLNGALTSVGIVLPEKIYETAAAIRRDPELTQLVEDQGGWVPPERDDVTFWELSKWEFALCQELNRYGLAS